MKPEKTILIYTITLICAGLMLLNSCKKDTDTTNPPQQNNILFNPDLSYGTVTDIEGNVYKTIIIGTQTWMAENLKVTKYRNGDPIANVIYDTAWKYLTTGAYCNYKNEANYATTYGRLYNWYAIFDSRNIAPAGWHMPTEKEWSDLSNYLGNNAGYKLKETGSTHWKEANEGATNSSGFTALPGGWRFFEGDFYSIGYHGDWWCSADSISANPYYKELLFDNNDLWVTSNFKSIGLSVRCVKDN
jgi:uncharacterized protein (TIGR02145 family)